MDPSDNQQTELIITKPLTRSTRSKIIDAIIILIILIVGGLFEFQFIGDPRTQFIPGLDNQTSINFNFAYHNTEEQIGTIGLLLIIFLPWYLILTISIIYLYYFDKQFSWNKCLTHLNIMHRMLFFCFAVTLLVTDVIKLFTGAPRPYFLEIYNETPQDKTELHEAKLSFISGHASQAMSSAILLTILMYKSWKHTQNMYYNRTYIIGIGIYNPHSYYLCDLWWIMRDIPLIAISIIFTPMYIAMWCGLTRITDYKHFAADVVGGMIVGAMIGWITYLIFYNEMYIGFDYELNVKIKELYENTSENMSDKEVNKKEQENAVPLQQIISDSAQH